MPSRWIGNHHARAPKIKNVCTDHNQQRILLRGQVLPVCPECHAIELAKSLDEAIKGLVELIESNPEVVARLDPNNVTKLKAVL